MTDQYAAPQSEVLSHQSDEAGFQYVGFWARLVASILDSIWLFVVMAILFFVLSLVGVIDLEVAESNGAEALFQVLALVLVVALWIKYASTPGKMAFGAKILDAKTFGEVPPGRLFLRYIAYFLSSLPLFLGFIWVAFDGRKQGWHDKIAGTVVVKEKP